MKERLDRKVFIEQYKLWLERKITIREGLEALGTHRTSTWYELRKECKLMGLI
ncbi:hypothetical protein [Cetobacterium sp.]|uniref:hypothetical protein n=1 Tax=Cetobacterium sp. TaxID=2071632 RepID=UPI003F353AAE